jgi:sugar phosphate isomerase/epimerase
MYPSFNARAAGLSLPAAETIEIAAATGFGGVDLLVRDLLDAGERPEALRRRMDDLGLVGGAFPMPVSWRGDEATFRRDLAALPRLLDAASTLGLLRTATWVMPEIPPAFAPHGPEAGREATTRFHVDRLSALAGALAPYRVRLGLEAIGVERFRSGKTPPFITRLGDLGPVLDPIGAANPGVGLLLDTYHLYASSEPLDDALARGVGAIVWVHVADLPAGAPADPALMEDHVRGLPGDNGEIDNRGILAALRRLGYDGPVTAEPLALCRSLAGLDSRATASAVARSIRSIWPAG